jgi:hypothetical protein
MNPVNLLKFASPCREPRHRRSVPCGANRLLPAPAAAAAATPDRPRLPYAADKQTGKIQVAAGNPSSCSRAYFSYSRLLLHSRKRLALQPHPSKRRLRAIPELIRSWLSPPDAEPPQQDSPGVAACSFVTPACFRCGFRDFARANSRRDERIWRTNLSQPRKQKLGPIPSPPVRSRHLP